MRRSLPASGVPVHPVSGALWSALRERSVYQPQEWYGRRCRRRLPDTSRAGSAKAGRAVEGGTAAAARVARLTLVSDNPHRAA